MRTIVLMVIACAAAGLVSAQQPVNCPGPLSEAQLTDLVKNQVADKRLQAFVETCGVGFAFSDLVKGRLRAAGASANLLAEIRTEETRQQLHQQAEQALWEAIKDNRIAEPYEDYLKRYPNGQFAAMAKARIATIRAESLRGQIRQALEQQQWDTAESRVKELESITGEDQETRDWRQSLARPLPTVAGIKKVNPKDGLTYVWIPPGRFMMGCSPGDPECDNWEKPAHDVTISKGFWMGQTPVPVGAWKRYGEATGRPRMLNAAVGDDFPVVFVEWNDAVSYCRWAGMRLPTQGEWEWAARGGTTGARYGNLDDIAWYADNSGSQHIDSAAIWNTDQKNYGARLNENGNGPKPVGEKQGNAYGLYDMLGNVWQWTADWYGEKYYEVSEKQDPSGPSSGTMRTLRGGSWFLSPRNVRVSDRIGDAPSSNPNDFGLRCVGESEQEQQRQQQAERALWEAIKDNRTAQPFEDYLTRYPYGQFTAVAKARLATIYADSLRGQVRQALEQHQWDTAESRVKELESITGEDQQTRGWRQSLAQLQGVPAVTVAMRPGTWKYKLSTETGRERIVINETTTVREENGAWTVSDVVETPKGQGTATSILEKDTLILREYSYQEGAKSMALAVEGNEVSGSINMNEEETPISTILDGPLFGDPGLKQCVALLPLADSYATTFRDFEPNTQQVFLIQLKVTGSKRITVPAGTFDTFRVDLSFAAIADTLRRAGKLTPQTLAAVAGFKITVWIAKNPRKAVKTLTVIPKMKIKMTAELE